MLKRIITTLIIFAGGDIGGGGDTNVTIMPSFVEAGGAVSVNVQRLGHGAASPSFRKAVDKTVFIRVRS